MDIILETRYSLRGTVDAVVDDLALVVCTIFFMIAVNEYAGTRVLDTIRMAKIWLPDDSRSTLSVLRYAYVVPTTRSTKAETVSDPYRV